jgi:hypothetical protein
VGKLSIMAGLTFVALVAGAGSASAKSCSELRALCWTMRADRNDCTRPYQRCLQTGKFITPLGRVFKATRRE